MNSAPVSTLARGVARRVAREAGINPADSIRRNPKRSRRHWINHRVEDFRRVAGPWYVGAFRLAGASNKKPIIYLVSIEQFTDGRDLGLLVVKVDARNFQHSVETPSIVFAQHAIERIAQRLKAYDPVLIAEELRPAARQLIRGSEDIDAELFFPTPHGVLLGDVEEGVSVIKTFVADSQLRPEQMQRKYDLTDL